MESNKDLKVKRVVSLSRTLPQDSAPAPCGWLICRMSLWHRQLSSHEHLEVQLREEGMILTAFLSFLKKFTA